mgnify:FL=1
MRVECELRWYRENYTRPLAIRGEFFIYLKAKTCPEYYRD